MVEAVYDLDDVRWEHKDDEEFPKVGAKIVRAMEQVEYGNGNVHQMRIVEDVEVVSTHVAVHSGDKYGGKNAALPLT